MPNSHGLVGNVDWGESLAVVACEFPGLNMRLLDYMYQCINMLGIMVESYEHV